MYSPLTSELFQLCPWPEETKRKMRRKLCLWHTPTLTPIFTHNKLERIMASIHFSPIIPGPASTDSLTGMTSAGRENEGVNGEQGENLTSAGASTDSLTGTTSAGRKHEGVNGEQGENLTSTDASTDSMTGATSAGRENEGVNGEQGENLTSTDASTDSLTGTTSAGRENEGVNGEHGEKLTSMDASTDSMTGTALARRENEGVNGEQGEAGRENEGINGEQGENLTSTDASTDSLTGMTSAGRENEGVNVKQGENLTSTDASTDSLTGTTSAGRENEGVNGEQGGNLTSMESVQWRDYRFTGMPLKKDGILDSHEKRSWPRLPYPRVDGLHLKSYLAFLGALECYIDPLVVANMFHIRPTPIDSRDKIYKTVYREIKNLILDPEVNAMVPKFYFYREDTLDDASEETHGKLKASVNNDLSKYVRKDETRKIEEDERDDSSDFVCLIDQGDALCGELSKDDWENTEACCSSSKDYLRELTRCRRENVHRSKRKVVKKMPQLVDIYKELLESLQREDFLEKNMKDGVLEKQKKLEDGN